MKPLQLILVYLFICVAANYTYAQNANELIGNYFTAIGGYEKMHAVQTFSCEGIELFDGAASSVKTTIDEGKLWRQDRSTEKEKSFLLLKNNEGWEYKNNELTKLPDSLFTKNKGTFFLESALSQYSQPGFNAILIGKDTVNGILCYKIKVWTNTEDSLYCWFDTMTKLLIKTSTKTSVGFQQKKGVIKDIPVYKNTIYRDYKNTGGLLYPFSYLNEGVEIATGKVIRKINFYATKIEVNKPITEKMYNPE